MEPDKAFLNAKEIAGILRVSCSQAYTIIAELNAKLNAELEALKYRTVRGKVNAAYFVERYFYHK